jgi:hypothetical protein
MLHIKHIVLKVLIFFFTPWIMHFVSSVFTLHLAIFSLVFLNLSFLKVCTEVFFSVILCLAFYFMLQPVNTKLH